MMHRLSVCLHARWPDITKVYHLGLEGAVKGNSHQITLSEMSLPGVEGLIEKLLPKILG